MFPYRLIRIVDHRAILDKPPNKVNVQARGFFRGTIEKKTSRESQIVGGEKERKKFQEETMDFRRMKNFVGGTRTRAHVCPHV